MGRSPCCSKGVNRGAWTALEDKILMAYIKAHGEGKWRNLPKRAGLKRCGKSCRLRWLNYLRPDIKRGNVSYDEEELIIRLHNLLGNRWSLIAGRLPGRTDNEIKNYWNTTLGKKVQAQPSSKPSKQRPKNRIMEKKPTMVPLVTEQPLPPSVEPQPQVIRTKALRCTKVLIPPPHHQAHPSVYNSTSTNPQDSDSLMRDLGTDLPCYPDSNSLHVNHVDFENASGFDDEDNNNLLTTSDHSLLLDELKFEDWTANDRLDLDAALDLGSLASFLDSVEWL